MLTSTNDRAKQCAAEECGELPLLIVADEQTAGRGRGANRWWTGPGSLAFTLLLDGRAGDRESRSGPLVSLATAVAVVDAVVPLLPGRAVGIHWPNDVYAAGRKIAGILVEVLSNARLVVGIGLNVNNTAMEAPADLRPKVATLRDLSGAYHDPTLLLIEILRHLATSLDELAVSPDRISRLADVRCLQHDRTLAVESNGRIIRGVCAGIAPDGALVLETAGGREKIVSGVLR